MEVACTCGRVVEVEPDRQEICGSCQRPVHGPGFDPDRFYGPKLGDAFSELRERNHWDVMLAAWLIGLGVLLGLGGWGIGLAWLGPVGCLGLVPGWLIGRGGVRLLRMEVEGLRRALLGLGILAAPIAVVLAISILKSEEEVAMASAAALVVPAVTMGVVVWYMRHPLNRYRFGRIDRDELERQLGRHRYDMLLHRLTLEAEREDSVDG